MGFMDAYKLSQGQPLPSSSYYGRISPFMPGSATSAGAGEATSNTIGQLGRIARNPYAGIPKSYLYNANEAVEDQYTQARQGLQGAISGAGAGGGGVAKGLLGNLEAGRGAGMAEAARSWDDLRARIGNERISSLLLPFLNEQYGAHEDAIGALYGQPKKQQGPNPAGSFLSGLVGAGMSAYQNQRNPAYAGGDPMSDYYTAFGGMG